MLPATVEHPALALLPLVPTRDEIERFGEFILSVEAEKGIVDIGTSHHVNSDLYGRGVVLQPETFLVGLAHKRPGFAICVGDITVWTERGRERFTGAHIIQTQPGHMRIGFAHAETTWFTVHRNVTGEVDFEMIEESLVVDAHRLMTRRTPALAA